MAETFTGLRVERVRDNLERVLERIAAGARDPQGVAVLAATKYVPAD